MRRLIVVVVVLAIAAIGVWAATRPSTVAPSSPAAQQNNAIPDDARPATVNYVHDGDTLFLDTGADPNLKVRLLAIDTPEVGDNAECFGDEATAYLRGLAPEGSTVYTLADVEPRDQYGRALLFLWTPDGTLINLDLVEQGYAEAVFIGANRLYESEFEAAEDAAQDAGHGIWGSC